MSQNPLAKHFRQPAIYVKLPSQGKFWPEGSLTVPTTGELPVYPMTARDEITLRTPDALLNGQGVVDVIQSCCPNIKNAWDMPSLDVDAILLYIRIASYGNKMDFDTNCPACQNENNFDIDLSSIIANTIIPNYDQTVDYQGMTIKLKPQPYFELNKANQVEFTQQQILRTVNDTTLEDEKRKEIADQQLNYLVELNINICVNCTRSITTEDGTEVTNKDFIAEFYKNADYRILKTVQLKLGEITQDSGLKPIHTVCNECKHEYDVPLTFDYAHFFG